MRVPVVPLLVAEPMSIVSFALQPSRPLFIVVLLITSMVLLLFGVAGCPYPIWDSNGIQSARLSLRHSARSHAISSIEVGSGT